MLAVLAIAVALIVVRYLQYILHPEDAAAYGGMWAGGDMMLELFICLLLMIPTVFLVFVIRKSETATETYAKVLFGFRHGSLTHPQFRHHRPYRSWEEHACRPPAGAYRLADGARDGGPGAGHDGPGARARHHHQGAFRPHDVSRGRWPDVSAQPDRHSRPCGLQL
jgi:hypothetical protein